MQVEQIIINNDDDRRTFQDALKALGIESRKYEISFKGDQQTITIKLSDFEAGIISEFGLEFVGTAEQKGLSDERRAQNEDLHKFN